MSLPFAFFFLEIARDSNEFKEPLQRIIFTRNLSDFISGPSKRRNPATPAVTSPCSAALHETSLFAGFNARHQKAFSAAVSNRKDIDSKMRLYGWSDNWICLSPRPVTNIFRRKVIAHSRQMASFIWFSDRASVFFRRGMLNGGDAPSAPSVIDGY